MNQLQRRQLGSCLISGSFDDTGPIQQLAITELGCGAKSTQTHFFISKPIPQSCYRLDLHGLIIMARARHNSVLPRVMWSHSKNLPIGTNFLNNYFGLQDKFYDQTAGVPVHLSLCSG